MAVPLVLLLLLWSTSGGSNPQTLIVETNKDLLLELHHDGNLSHNELFVWKNSKGDNIVRDFLNSIIINNDYKDRVEYCSENRSLILKNVRLVDSGVYTAAVSRKTQETLATFNVSVEDPVSAVSLSLDSVSHSSDSCNFTVSCRTELFSISRSFTCDTHSCEEAQHSVHAHSGSSSLHLYLSNLSVICNHSNHVSWTEDTEVAQQMCLSSLTNHTGAAQASVWSVCAVKTVVYTVGLLLMLSALITAHVLEHRSKQH